MGQRLLASIGARSAVTLVVSLMPVVVTGQTPPAEAKRMVLTKIKPAVKTPRTRWGDPDLQGIWSTATTTPLERPSELAGKEFFTEEEAAEYEKRALERFRKALPVEAELSGEFNEVWVEGGKVVPGMRTSLIVNPPDGRIPPMTAEAQKQAVFLREALKKNLADGPEDRLLSERCILWGAGPPMLPRVYNSNVQILQTPRYVAILLEMIHDVRIISLDGRPHLPSKIRQWLGDSRGHWEGDTLVVDTTNFTDRTEFGGFGSALRVVGAALHVIERFTRVDADIIFYEFAVDDPGTWTKPWSAAIPIRKTQGPIYEYACHEGNYGMTNILSGARAEEKAAGEAAKRQLK